MSKLVGLLVAFSCWLAILLSGARCAALPPVSSAQSHYERPSTKGGPYNERVVVFVHGLFGDADSTWRYSPSVYWPRLLLTDAAFRDSDIYVASYSTPYLGNKMNLDEVVTNLNNRLVSDEVFSKHREVVFVCHSLGGLVIQRLLLTFRQYAQQVPFIYFFSTPETGAQIANLGSVFSSDPLLKAMFVGDEHVYLQNLENEWKGAQFHIHRLCAYEKKTYKGVIVVDRLSGTRNCDEPPIAINEDHLGIVKPNSAEHDSYIALRNAIIAEPIRRRPSTPAAGRQPPIIKADSFSTLVPLHAEWKNSPIPLNANPDDPHEEFYGSLAGLANRPDTAPEGWPAYKERRLESLDAQFAFVTRLVQFYLFRSIYFLQRGVVGGMKWTAGVGVTPIDQKPIAPPDAVPYPTKDILETLSGNEFLNPIDKIQLTGRPLTMPSGTRVFFIEHANPDKGEVFNCHVRLERPGYFTVDFGVQPGPGMNNQLPAGFSTRAIRGTTTYTINIAMKYEVQKRKDHGFQPDQYAVWIDSLFEGLRKQMGFTSSSADASATVVRSLAQGAGSIAQIGGERNTAIVTNNFAPPSRSVTIQDRQDLVAALSHNKAKAHVLYLISDNEAFSFAQQIYDILTDAGWDLPDKMVRPVMPQAKFPPGVRVGFHGEVHPDNSQIDISDERLEGKVIKALLKANLQGVFVNSRPDVEEGSIEFLVTSSPTN